MSVIGSPGMTSCCWLSTSSGMASQVRPAACTNASPVAPAPGAQGGEPAAGCLSITRPQAVPWKRVAARLLLLHGFCGTSWGGLWDSEMRHRPLDSSRSRGRGSSRSDWCSIPANWSRALSHDRTLSGSAG